MNVKKFPGIRGLSGLSQLGSVYDEPGDTRCMECHGHGWVRVPDGASTLDVGCERCGGTGQEPDAAPDDATRQYPTRSEDIMLAGTESDALYEPDADRGPVDVKRTCASKKLPFEYLKFDTCATPVKGAKSYPAITSSRDVVKLLFGSVPFANTHREWFMVVCLDSRNTPVGVTSPHVGGRASATVDAGVVLQAVLLSGAVSFIVAHNHPSGDPAPSPEDIALTKLLASGAKSVNLSLLDHIVVEDSGSYFSFLDRGLMPR